MDRRDRRTTREKEDDHKSGQMEGLPRMDRRTIREKEDHRSGQTEGLQKMDRRTIQEKEEDCKSGQIEEDETRLMTRQRRIVEGEYS
jgi:hypothetical protein